MPFVHTTTNFPARLFLTIVLVSALILSCKKTDSIDVPKPCDYLGKGYRLESKTGNVVEHESTINQDEKGLLMKASTYVTNISRDLATNIEYSRSMDEKEISFTYDPNGYLKQMKTVKVYQIKNASGFTYNGKGPFKQMRLETVETTVFVYSGGKVTSSQLRSVESFSGDNQSITKTITESKKIYQNDANGMPVTCTEASTDGSSSVTTYKNGVRVLNSSIMPNGDKVNTYYNALGLLSETNLPLANYNYKYDDKGNFAMIEMVSNNVTTYTQEFKYDDHPNPESHIPKYFKGIPDPIITVQSTDGVNNLIESLYTNLSPSKLVTVYSYANTYNEAGYPATTTLTIKQSPDNEPIITTFKYKDCQRK